MRVVILTFRNLLPKGTFGAQMVDLGLPHIIHSLKTQAWSDEVRYAKYIAEYCFLLAVIVEHDVRVSGYFSDSYVY